MKITGFSIQMGSERTYTSTYASSEKREMYVKNAGSTGLLTGDSVSISKESYSKTRSEYGFRAASRSVVSIEGEHGKAENTKSVIETMTRELTGKNVIFFHRCMNLHGIVCPRCNICFVLRFQVIRMHKIYIWMFLHTGK